MLRRTAARAFGSEGRPGAPPARGLPETHRGAAVERLFADLHQALDGAARQLASPPGGEASGTPPAAEEPRGPLRVSRPRSLPHGVEFLVEGPAASLRFLNTQLGMVRVSDVRPEAGLPEDVLSVQFQGGQYRSILKVLPPVSGGPEAEPRPPFCARRTTFVYVPVRELARRYRRWILER